MYKLSNDPKTNELSKSVSNIVNNSCIPFNPANMDYVQFKEDLANGIQLSDANNNIMTADQVAAFLNTLP